MYSPEGFGKSAGTMGRYDRVVVADCLWMASQHENLLTTIRHALDEGPDCCAIVVAGFHTGRGIVRDFFDSATCGQMNGTGDGKHVGVVGKRLPETVLKIADIYELDIDRNRREWQRTRENESNEAAKRWCVVAVLARYRP